MAGIKVFMVTGDQPLTAKSIARQIGLIGEGPCLELLKGPIEIGDDHWNEFESAGITPALFLNESL